jgi:hypothetical protein
LEQEEKDTKRGDGSERECLRCGSLIPLQDDEGLCPTCGTEYGRATIAMPALAKPLDFGVTDNDVGDHAPPPHRVDLAVAHAAEPKRKSNALLWVVAIVFILLALGIAALALILFLAKTSSAPPPLEPPAIEKINPDDGTGPASDGSSDQESE